MDNRTKERWVELCERVQIEQDPAKMLELCREISRILEEKENRLRMRNKPANGTPNSTPKDGTSEDDTPTDGGGV